MAEALNSSPNIKTNEINFFYFYPEWFNLVGNFSLELLVLYVMLNHKRGMLRNCEGKCCNTQTIFCYISSLTKKFRNFDCTDFLRTFLKSEFF